MVTEIYSLLNTCNLKPPSTGLDQKFTRCLTYTVLKTRVVFIASLFEHLRIFEP